MNQYRLSPIKNIYKLYCRNGWFRTRKKFYNPHMVERPSCDRTCMDMAGFCLCPRGVIYRPMVKPVHFKQNE